MYALVLSLVAGTVSAQSLTLKWKSDTTLRVPESVFFDAKANVLYVANIDGQPDGKDGKGFISKLSPADGKIIKREWVSGLNAPKGMGLVKNNLYVADLFDVVQIDIASGKIVKTYPVEGAKFLNDVTTDEKGNVYISDSGTGKVHKLSNGKVEVFFESADIKGTNGLLAQKDALLLADFPTGDVFKLDWTSKKLTKFASTAQGGDGLVSTGKGEYILSLWFGEVYAIDAAGKSVKLLDTKEQKENAADVAYDEKTQTLFIPTFFANGVAAYTFKK
jgi:sugar lactone lactonase YvrE